MSTQQTTLNRVATRRQTPPLFDRRVLMEKVDSIRTTRLTLGTLSGVLWSGLGFLGTLLCWMWGDVILDLSPRLRILSWLCAAGVLGIILFRWIRYSRTRAEATAIAADLDQLTASSGQIQTGLDLADDIRNGKAARASVLTQGLAQLAVGRAASLASKASNLEAASPKPLFKSLAAVIVAFVAIIVFSAIMPRMAWTELKRFFDPFGGHAAWSQYDFQVALAKTAIAYGDSLDITATVQGPPFEQLEMVLVASATDRQKQYQTLDVETAEPLDVIPMFPDSSGGWHASIASVTEPFEFFLRVRRARSQVWPVTVITTPSITDVQVEISPPLYTGLAPFRGTMPASGIEGLRGTMVSVTAASNRPLLEGQLGLLAEGATTTVGMAMGSDPNRVTGSFEIITPGQLEIAVVDTDKQRGITPFSVPVQVLSDDSPIVRLTNPRPVSFATPTAIIPIVVAAEDDYGLRRCQLYRSLNNSRPLPTDLQVPEGAPRRLQLQTQLPLAEYELQPGDEIKLFARVEDNDPNGPNAPIGKGTESSIVSIRIISDEDFNRVQQQQAGMEMMTSRHQQAQRRMESLAEQLKQLKEKLDAADPDSKVAEELRQEMKQLAAEMQKSAEALQEMAEKPLPFDLDKELAPQLAEMAEMLRKLSEQTNEMAADSEMSSKQASEEVQKNIEAMQQKQQQHKENAMKPLEHMAQVLPLKQDEAAFTQLVQRQRALADRLKSLKDQDADADPATKARMREMEEEQHRLREQLTDLLNRMDEDIASLPDDPELDELRQSAQEFLDAVRGSGADGMMADAESSLTQFDGTNGSSNAEQAAATLEKFLSQCNGMGKACEGSCMKFSPGLGSSMANTLGQLSPGMGMKPGSGMGMGSGGSGGYSSQSSTMDNVGMYGTTPLMDAMSASSGTSDKDAPTGVMTQLTGDPNDQAASGVSGRQTNSAFGNAENGVPSQYRRQAGQYLQRLADELER